MTIVLVHAPIVTHTNVAHFYRRTDNSRTHTSLTVTNKHVYSLNRINVSHYLTLTSLVSISRVCIVSVDDPPPFRRQSVRAMSTKMTETFFRQMTPALLAPQGYTLSCTRSCLAFVQSPWLLNTKLPKQDTDRPSFIPSLLF